MVDYKKTIESRQQEAVRIRNELKKAEVRVATLRQKLMKKNREIKDLLKADHDQWLRMMVEQLDTAFREKKGDHYWQDLAHEDVVGMVMEKVAVPGMEDLPDTPAGNDEKMETEAVNEDREEP